MILVTGGTGFLGRFIVDELLSAGHSVRVMARNPAGSPLAAHEKLEVVEGDLRDPTLLDAALEGVERIVHCAALVTFWKQRHAEMHAINVEGTANLVDLALQHGVQQFVHISSIAAQGRATNSSKVDEQTKWKESKRNTAYAVSKYRSEKEVFRGLAEGLPLVVLNPGLILGIGADWTKGTPRLFKTVAGGLKYYNQGVTGLVSAKDVAKAVKAVVDANLTKGEKFVLVSENRSYKNMLELIAKGLSVPAPSKSVSPGVGRFAGRVLEFFSLISGNEPLITEETGRVSGYSYEYDGSKITRTLPFSYEPIEGVIDRTAKAYLQAHGTHG